MEMVYTVDKLSNQANGDMMYEFTIWYKDEEGTQGRSYLFVSIRDAHMAKQDHLAWFKKLGYEVVAHSITVAEMFEGMQAA